jgi:hypothetical protein
MVPLCDISGATLQMTLTSSFILLAPPSAAKPAIGIRFGAGGRGLTYRVANFSLALTALPCEYRHSSTVQVELS